jgi:ribonucleoside-diphosphate reductase alpha chain
LIAGVESGIEPFFALATARRVLGEPAVVEIHPGVADLLQRLGGARDSAFAAIRASGSIRGLESLPESLRRSYPTALEIAPEYHLRMQAAFQAHVDGAVSKTVNLPADASRDQVRQIFVLARQLRLKGVTVYRYGSRPGQSLSLLDGESHPICGAESCDAA